MLRNNFVKKKLINGDVVIGTWSIIPSPIVTDILCFSGLDFIIIDSEHGPISFETAQEMGPKYFLYLVDCEVLKSGYEKAITLDI